MLLKAIAFAVHKALGSVIKAEKLVESSAYARAILFEDAAKRFGSLMSKYILLPRPPIEKVARRRPVGQIICRHEVNRAIGQNTGSAFRSVDMIDGRGLNSLLDIPNKRHCRGAEDGPKIGNYRSRAMPMKKGIFNDDHTFRTRVNLGSVRFRHEKHKSKQKSMAKIGVKYLKKLTKLMASWTSKFIDFLMRLYYKDNLHFIKDNVRPAVLLKMTRLARKIRDGDITSGDAVKAYVKRMKQLSKYRINNKWEGKFERALDEAEEIDEDINDNIITESDFDAKPFLGVPFTIQLLELPWGMQEISDFHKEMLQTRLKDAGAIFLGVCDLPQYELYSKPYVPSYHYIPSSLDEVTGPKIKPGYVDDESTRTWSYDLYGTEIKLQTEIPQGITFRDNYEFQSLKTIVNPLDDLYPEYTKAVNESARKKLITYQEVDVSKLRYYFIETNDNDYPTTNVGTKRVMRKVINYFKELSMEVEQINLASLAQGSEVRRHWNLKTKFEPITLEETFGTHDLESGPIFVMLNTTAYQPIDEERAQNMSDELKSALFAKLENDDAPFFVSMPANNNHFNYMRPSTMIASGLFSLLKLPLTQVPMVLNVDDVLLGVQVVGGFEQDHLCLAVAKELEKFGGYILPF